MKKRRKILVIALVYFISIPAFAMSYFLLWKDNPSQFIVNEHYNEHTIRPTLNLQDFDYTNIPIKELATVQKTNELIQHHVDTIAFLEKSSILLSESLMQLKAKDGVNRILLTASYKKNYDAYFDSLLRPFNVRKDSLQHEIKKIDDLEKNVQRKSSRYYDNELSKANLNVLIARNDLELSKCQYTGFTNIRSMKDFYDSNLFAESKLIFDSSQHAENENMHVLENIFEHKKEINNIASDFYRNQVVRLNYWDFIYFSIISASSTGFGDILPNTTMIRLMVSAQIIMSMFLFGFFFYFISQQD